MREKNDMVFPVSLSEIAFTLVFLLMLLLGFMILSERKENDEVRAQIAELEHNQFTAKVSAAAASAMAKAQLALSAKMTEAGAGTPEQVAQVFKEFVNVGEAKVRQEQLEQEVLDLTRKLVAMEELRQRVEQAGRKVDEKMAREEVEQAIALRSEIVKLIEPPPPAASVHTTPTSGAASSPTAQLADITTGKSDTPPLKRVDHQQATERIRQAITATRELREQAKTRLGRDVAPGQEVNFVRDVVEGARRAAVADSDKSSPQALEKENATLRTQVAFFDKRDKLRGLDHPPCWMDASSKIEYIFNVQTTQIGFVVTRGWLPHREAQARASPGFDDLMGDSGAPLSAAKFGVGAKPFLDYGKAQLPECRHFVYLTSTIADADRRDDARRLVNSFFYVLERKSPVVP